MKREKGQPEARARRRAAPGKVRTRAPAPQVASQLPAPTPGRVEAARRKLERGVLARGEAVPAGMPLPPGATHEVVGHEGDGRPILKRRRFSLR